MKKAILSFFVVFIICLSFLPLVDKISYENNDKFLKRATATFVIAKGMNGVISFLQGTQIEGGFIFVGATFSIGELLDPLNDMVERFSWVMLASSIALGIEKILIQIGGAEALKYLFLGVGVLLFFTIWFEKLSIFRNWVFKIFLILAIVRFIMPLSEIINMQIYSHITQSTYNQAKESLQNTKDELNSVKNDIKKDTTNDQTIANPLKIRENFIDKALEAFNGKYNSIKKSVVQTFDFSVEKKINDLLDKVEASYDDMKLLMSIFIFQTILFPFLTLWLGYKIVSFIILKDRVLK